MKHRFLKTIVGSAFMLSSVAFAQSGLLGGSDGIHQHNAYTMGSLQFKVGVSAEAFTDNWGLTRGGQFVDPNGITHEFDKWKWGSLNKGRIDGSVSANFNLAMGITDFLDFGASLPIYYDHAKEDSRISARMGMFEEGVGDVEIWTKYKFPQFHEGDMTTLAVELNVTLPTGTKNAGLRPRHAWFLNDKRGGNTYAYTANDVVVGGNVIATIDYSKLGVPLRWNTNLGYRAVVGDGSNTFVYGTGVNYLAQEWLDVFLEFSGEMRLYKKNQYSINPWVDPMVLTPGVRFRIPGNFELALGLDIGVNNLRNYKFDIDKEMKNCKSFTLQFEDGDGRKSHYCYSSGPMFAGTATLTWQFGKEAVKDVDEDGVMDNVDQCLDTPKGHVVDSLGCSVDSDKDGVFDGPDQCPGTPEGAVVDSAGCPIDSDEDKVFDGFDKCPNTPKGATVDSLGCPMDTDSDGVLDGLDKCPDTPKGHIVDGSGCSMDSDKDGIFDGPDQCPDTPEGASIDEVGCTDSDRDGVSDLKDKCPNTLFGVKVDAFGCPLEKKQDLDKLKQGIKFKTGSAKLVKASYSALNDIAALMKEFKNANLEVQGHTDASGSEKKNMVLSEKRARAVTDYLEKKGIESKRLRAKGFGPLMPIADNETKEGRTKNRRVELIPFEFEIDQK